MLGCLAVNESVYFFLRFRKKVSQKNAWEVTHVIISDGICVSRSLLVLCSNLRKVIPFDVARFF